MAATYLQEQDVIGDIAASLGIEPGEVTDEGNLTDLGMDSIRTMSLIEKWRSAGVEGADFIALASEPTLTHWLNVLTGRETDEEKDKEKEEAHEL
ncbi:phosphopantetheine-binding protein [Corynebacterium neomassiliense]|uniref:phosphopantetheine-binding protein n=1 Tax=Corynebacterium neomassiliense TaxID=2079482 RepID=UPI001030328F|nr:phosphopantetheine-binding protein [Corynebacterium neomassiliense]